jgi:hypothetical protein
MDPDQSVSSYLTFKFIFYYEDPQLRLRLLNLRLHSGVRIETVYALLCYMTRSSHPL